MKMIQAVIRPEKERDVIDSLTKSGIHAFTRMDVFGRGRQQGLVVGSVKYEELPKIMLWVTVKNNELDRALEAIKISSRTGNPGDGKLFVFPLIESLTLRTGQRDEG